MLYTRLVAMQLWDGDTHLCARQGSIASRARMPLTWSPSEAPRSVFRSLVSYTCGGGTQQCRWSTTKLEDRYRCGETLLVRKMLRTGTSRELRFPRGDLPPRGLVGAPPLQCQHQAKQQQQPPTDTPTRRHGCVVSAHVLFKDWDVLFAGSASGSEHCHPFPCPTWMQAGPSTVRKARAVTRPAGPPPTTATSTSA